jgi:FtsP/CotA-like multicopper oxidase with cupredoxin domain
MVRRTSISLTVSKALTLAGQFPGPTIEARSGDILEIEIFNLAEESLSLHWHGLHMRGGSAVILRLVSAWLTWAL